MDNRQWSDLQNALLQVAERFAETATTAAEVEALAAVAQAIVAVERC